MRTSFLYAVCAVLAWSTMPIVGKTLLTQFDSLEILGYGSLIGAVFLTVILIINGDWKKFHEFSRRDLMNIGITGFVGFFLYSDLYMHGLSLLPAHIAGTINYVWPVFAILLSALFLKEKITFKAMASIIISMTGVCVLMLQSSGGSGIGSLAGYACCLAAAMLYAFFNISNKKIGKNELLKTAVYLYISGISSVILKIPQGFTIPHGMQVIGFLWLGIVIDALAYLLWAVALQKERTSLIVNLSYLTPVLSTVLSVLTFNEKIDLSTMAGLVLILAGVVLQAVKRKAGTPKRLSAPSADRLTGRPFQYPQSTDMFHQAEDRPGSV